MLSFNSCCGSQCFLTLNTGCYLLLAALQASLYLAFQKLLPRLTVHYILLMQSMHHLMVLAEYVGVVKTGSEQDKETAGHEDGLGIVMVDKVKALEQTGDHKEGKS